MSLTLDLGTDVWPPIPTVAERAKDYIGMVDTITSKTILAGFDYAVNGVTYHFSYGIEDQTNFAQANTSAALSLQLGSMTNEQLIAQYGATAEGTVDETQLPERLPSKWSIKWNGHTIEDDRVVSLIFNPREYLALAAASGLHNVSTLEAGRELKRQLLEAASDEILDKVVKDNDIVRKFQEISQSAA